MKSKTNKPAENLLFLTAIPPLVGLFLSFAKADLRILIPLAIGLPALLVAFTSLLFNRARAWPIGRMQRRSLLAGEIFLRAVYAIVLTVLIALAITYFMPKDAYLQAIAPSDSFFPNLEELNPLLFFYVLPCLTFFSAYVSSWQAFKLILHKSCFVAQPKGLKHLFRSLKQ